MYWSVHGVAVFRNYKSRKIPTICYARFTNNDDILETNNSGFDKFLKEQFNLTRLDEKILDEMQADCRLSNQDLADRIGSSASSIWRRVRALQKAEVILGFNLTVAAEKLGLSETILLQVSLHTHSDKNTAAFDQLINELPEVLECYAVNGEYDYQLKVLATDMRAYYQFLEEKLLSSDLVARASSSVVMNKIKETRIVPTSIK